MSSLSACPEGCSCAPGGRGIVGSQGGKMGRGDERGCSIGKLAPMKWQGVSEPCGRQPLSLGSHSSAGRCSLERRGTFKSKAQELEAKLLIW